MKAKWVLGLLMITVITSLSIGCTGKSSESFKSATLHAATAVRFIDIDMDSGELEGDVIITKAGDESGITYYALYWGSSMLTKLSHIRTFNKSGNDLTHSIPADTTIPNGATHLLVYTGDDIEEMESGVYTTIGDAAPPRSESFDSAGSSDFAYSIQQTATGGFIVAGSTYVLGTGGPDAWIMKLDSAGDTSWEKKYGDPGNNQNDAASSIQQTTDGGYITAGYTGLNGDKDIWVLKLDSSGGVTWQNTYGDGDIGGGNDLFETAESIQQTDDDNDGIADDGFIVAGYTYTFPTNTDEKMWLLKIAVDGSVTWQKTYGGTGGIDRDRAYSVQQTTDGGYIMAGHMSIGASNRHIWVLKLDADGDVTWQKTYAGTGNEWGYSVRQTSEGGYILAGDTTSFGAGNGDMWVLKLDKDGAITWEKTYGGTQSDSVNLVLQTDDDSDGNADDGFIAVGHTNSFGAGNNDVWVLKLDSNGVVTWQKTFGGADNDYGESITQNKDGSFTVAGSTFSFDTDFGDLWLLKFYSDGTLGTLACDIGGDIVITGNTSISGTDTSATVVSTSISGIDTNITAVSTGISGTDTSATVRIQCSN
jgi:hypothetical protein